MFKQYANMSPRNQFNNLEQNRNIQWKKDMKIKQYILLELNAII